MEYTKYTKEQWKGSVITSPLPPTLVTCGSMDKPNVFTVAWTGILCTQPPVTYISVRPERYSHELITQSGEFVINLPTRELVKAVDWCGVKTGRKVDKFKEMHLTAEPSAKVTRVGGRGEVMTLPFHCSLVYFVYSIISRLSRCQVQNYVLVCIFCHSPYKEAESDFQENSSALYKAQAVRETQWQGV